MSSIAADRAGGAPPASAVATSAAVVEEAVRLDRVTKRFGAVTALSEVSLAIRRGELMTLLGPSGCGKTTILNLVAGFLAADGGEITIDGKRVNDIPTFRREIGMMFQNYALFPHMTVGANIGYGLKMRGVGKVDIGRQVSDALALVKLSGVEDRKPHQLSGGQQQRVALARALVIRPRVLLLDEPFSALDKSLRASMQVEIKEIQRRLGVTTIFVTHDQSEALSLSDRLAVMYEGRIRQIGTPQDIYRRPVDRFVASFVGDVNVLAARLEHIEGAHANVAVGTARVRVPSGPLGAAGAGAGAESDLFVRPEQLRIVEGAEAQAIDGVVTTQVYQGGHVDLYVESPAASSGRLIVRLPGQEAIARWQPGAKVRVALPTTDAIAFPRSS